MLGDDLGLLWENICLMSKLLHQAQEEGDSVAGNRSRATSDALRTEEPLNGSGKVLSIVLKVISVPHQDVEEEVRRQIVVIAKEVLAQQLLDKSTVGIVWRVSISKLAWDALM